MTVTLTEKMVGNTFNFARGDGNATVFDIRRLAYQLVTGTPIYQRTNWQGTSLLYSTARTNLLFNSLLVGGGAAPTNWTQLTGTGASTPVASLVGSPGTTYLQTATAQQPWFYVIPAVLANTTYTLSCVIESVSGGLTAINTIAVAGLPAGATFSYPVCPANPSGGSAGVVQTGVLLLQVVVAGTAGNCVCRVGIGAQGVNATGTLQFSSPQFEVGTTRTGFIATPAGASAAVTDYTLSNGVITLAQTTNPAVGQHANMARTNLALQSETMATSPWVTNSGTLTVTATTITDTDAAVASSRVQVVTIPNDSNAYWTSVVVGKNAPNLVMLRCGMSGGTPVSSAIVFDTVSGAWGQSSGYGTPPPAANVSVTDLGPEGWRIGIKLTNNSTGNVANNIFLYPAFATTLAGTGDTAPVATLTGSASFGKVQFERSDVLTSYIGPTTATAVKVVDISPTGGNGNGGTATFELSPAGTTPTLTALYKTDWQGKQLLYSTARTNVLPRSQDLATGWGLTAATLSTATAAPDGTTSLQAIVEDATTGIHAITGVTATILTATNYRFSAFFKAREMTKVLFNCTGAGLPSTAVSVDLVAGTAVSALGTPTNIEIVNLGNGLYWVAFRVVSTGVAGTIVFYTTTDGVWANRSHAGTAGNGIYAWGAMISAEGGSYIPTTTAAVTVTDYTLVGNTATLSPAPAVGSTITWDGSYTGGLGVGESLGRKVFDQMGKVI